MNKIFLIVLIIFGLFLSGCSTKSRYANYKYSGSETRTYSSNKNDYNTQMSKKAYKHPTMRPYVIYGVRYYPQDVRVGDKFSGNASWYGPDFHGKFTSNGERYNMYEMTAAHKTLPMNTVVRVVNKKNGLSTVVRINDRGPFVATRIIDLSNTAARKIKMIGAGTAPVTIEVLGFYSKNKRRSTVKTKFIKPKRITTSTRIKNTKNATYALQIASFTNIEGAMKIQKQHDNTDGYKTIIKDVQSDS